MEAVYIYFSSYFSWARVPLGADVTLLMFGIADLVGLWVAGLLIDPAPRVLVLANLSQFIIASRIFLLKSCGVVALVLWGIALASDARLRGFPAAP